MSQSLIMLCICFQRQRLINTTETRVNRITNGDSDSAARAQGRRGLENGMGVAEQGLNGRCRLQGLESGNETENENEDNENNENDEEGEGEDDSNGPLVPFKVPGAAQSMFAFVFVFSSVTEVIIIVSPSWGVQQAQVADHVAAVAASVLHRAQLRQATLGEMVLGLLLHGHHLDRRPVLHHGLDGQSSLCSSLTCKRVQSYKQITSIKLEDIVLI